MGQKIRPTGFRVGVMEDWRSRWYASKHEFVETNGWRRTTEFSDLLVEDFKIRAFIKKKYGFAGIPKIEIERTRDAVTVLLSTARPGVIIGRKGAEVEKLQEELQGMTGRRIEMVPGARIVQAWRFPSFPDGVYTVVHFTLAAAEGGTLLTLDQYGEPDDWHDHIAANWPTFYLTPLTEYFAAA